MMNDKTDTTEQAVFIREAPTLGRFVPVAWARDHVPSVPGIWPNAPSSLPFAVGSAVYVRRYHGWPEGDGVLWRFDQMRECESENTAVFLGIVRALMYTPMVLGGATMAEPGRIIAVAQFPDGRQVLADLDDLQPHDGDD